MRENEAAERTFDDVFRGVLRDVLDEGHAVTPGASLSVGSGRRTIELLNRSFTLPSARDRLLFGRKRLNLAAAVGRFAWMMAGSDRLAEIRYYDPNASRFTDDGVTVPGSCDGARILRPRGGINQLRSVIELLRNDPTSRRATMVIYHPEDAGRDSRDVPCIISVTYNIRQERLHTSVVLRSSNAARVLPYDLFFYSLIAEIVASELGVEVGSYHQFAVSLHIYDADVDLARAICSAERPAARPVMDPMPTKTAIADVSALLDLELRMRTAALPDARWAAEVLAAIELALPPFWQDFAGVLLRYAVDRGPAGQQEKREVAVAVTKRLGPAFQAVAG